MKYIFCSNCGTKNLSNQRACLYCRRELYPVLYVVDEVSSTLDRLCMHKSVTLSSNLSMTQARQQLTALVTTNPTFLGSGFLGAMSNGQYEGYFDGVTLQIRELTRYRQQRLLALGHLLETRSGVTLQVVLRIDQMILILVNIGVFSCIPMIMSRSLSLLPFSLIIFTFLYSILLKYFFVESRTIEKLLENTLFVRYEEKAAQEEAIEGSMHR
jgi:hypothetical protein